MADSNPKSQFSEPSDKGERAIRRLLREIGQETANVQTLFDLFDNSQNPRHRQQANLARANLEKTTNALRIATDVPELLQPRIAASLASADAILANFVPIEEPVAPPTPSISRLVILEDEVNAAPGLIDPPLRQPDALDAEGVTLPRDPGLDQGPRAPLASPLLPATPALRSVIGGSQAQPESRGDTAHVSPNSANRERDRASSSLSVSSSHQDAAIAVGAARQERLSQRQELRQRIERHRSQMEQLQLDLANAESLERARQADEQAEADHEVTVTLGEEAASACARTQPLARTQLRTQASAFAPVRSQSQAPPRTQLQAQAPPGHMTNGLDFPRICQPITAPTFCHPTPVYGQAPMPLPYNHVATRHPQPVTHVTTTANPPNPPPIPVPPQPSPAISVGDNQDLLQGDVQRSLLTVNLQANARNLMVQGRPPAQKRFAGGSADDLETFLNQFEKNSERLGVTDDMRFSELKFWTTGAAALVVSQYENLRDSTEALSKVKEHLREEFGSKLITARQMLDNLLVGDKFKESETENIQVFLLKLSQIHQRAIETFREGTFNTRETYDLIIAKKLPFYSKKWATRLTDMEAKIAKTKDYSKTLTFTDFLDHCRRQNNITRNDKAIFKTAASVSSPSPSSASGKPHQGKPVKKVAATEVEVAATTTSRPKNVTKNPQSKGASNNAPRTQHAAPAKSSGAGAKPKPAASQTTPKTGEETCLACSGGKHVLSACREFLKMNDEDRRSFVKKKGICFLCLVPGHMVVSCPSSDIRCGECNGKHNSVFHREKKQAPEEV